MGSQALRRDLGARREVVDQRISVVDQIGGVDGVWCRSLVVGKSGRRAAEQGDCTLDVATLDVGDADSELGQALPQHPLIVRAVLPCGLEHFVRVERQAPVQQILGKGQGLGRSQLEVVWNARNAFAALRKWSAESVARAGASGSAGFVAVTLGHVPIMASESRSAYLRSDK